MAICARFDDNFASVGRTEERDKGVRHFDEAIIHALHASQLSPRRTEQRSSETFLPQDGLGSFLSSDLARSTNREKPNLTTKIMITFKGTNRDFPPPPPFPSSSLRHELFPARALTWPGRNHVQITCNTSSGYHVRHVVLRASWHEGTSKAVQFDKV